jgi:hypothetical protein
MTRVLSTFLFANPSATSGAARMLDFWGFYDTYNISRNGAEADARALYSDWRAVGELLAETSAELASYKRETSEQRIETTATV